MQSLTFWKTITVDQSNLLETLVSLLSQHGIKYCVVGGQAVNAYAEPVVSLDLDLVIAAEQVEKIDSLLPKTFRVERHPHSINVSAPESDVRVQIQTDPRYYPFVDRATPRVILGLTLPVASVEDVLQGKVWAFSDPERRGSKRQKDLADIARLLENYPEYRSKVPKEVLDHLL